ncbi:MAG: 3-isopropylmalate dehydratase large subunit [Firmicutes bacterium]|nr:3-isopropylmalate dehydratase large subunit [Bacillota bacterium]
MKGHTATEKILALRGGVKEVFPGDVVTCDVDGVFVHSPWFFLDNWKLIGGVKRMWDPDKLIICLGHHVCLPSSNQYANDLADVRRAVKKYGFKHVYDMGTGNGHIIMLEKGHVRPGHVYVGADSHSTIYGAVGAFGTAMSYEIPEVLLCGKAWFKVPATVRVNLEGKPMKGVTARDVAQHVLNTVGADGALWKTIDFSGSYIHSLSVYQRMIFSLLAVEMGAVTGFIEPDDITREFLAGRTLNPFECIYNDPDCEFEEVWDIDVSKVEPQIAVPPRPSETTLVSAVEEKNIKVDQAFVGGCTGSSIEDFRMAAEILKGQKIHPDTRLLIVPGTADILKQLQKEDLDEFFTDMGAILSAPYCGPCQMCCYGHLGDGEIMIGTHPRNQPGRAGKNSGIYLASPYTVAAAAICGKIVDPRRFL